MNLILADSCCAAGVGGASAPVSGLCLGITFGIAAVVLALGIGLGLLIAKKKASRG